MILKRIAVKGEKGLTVNFGKINYILGENATGKTTLIKLILYSLGTKVDSFIDEISKENLSDHVELDVELKSGNVYRFIRKLPHSETILVVPLNEFNELIEENVEIKNLEEFSDMILIEEGYGTQEIPYGNNNKANMRYYFMLRAVTADQDTPAYKVLADLGGSTRNYINNQSLIKKAIIEALLGKENTEVQKARLKLQKLFKERSSLLSKIQIMGEVSSSNILSKEEFSKILKLKNKDKILEKIAEINNEKNKLSSKHSKYISKLGTSNSKINDKVSMELSRKISNARQDLNQLILQRDDITNVSQTITAEIEKLKKMIIARQVITLIPVEVCPVCLQKMAETTSSGDHCSYCKNEIDNNDLERISQYKRMLEESLFEANKVREELLNQINIAEQNKKNLDKKMEKMKEKFINEQMEKNTPIENLIESVKDRVEKLTKEEQVLEVHLGYLNAINELKFEKNRLEFEINTLKDELEQLEKSIYYSDVDKLDSWQKIFKEELNCVFGTKMEVSLDSGYTPIIDEVNIKNISSASLKVAARLTYITSLFHLQEVIDINHLGFVLLDSPKDKDLDMDKYGRFLEILEKSNNGQIILTGSIKEMDLYNRDNIIMTLFPDRRLLQ
jgi:DNA repair exonuclease SbcCD ATPase subunit